MCCPLLYINLYDFSIFFPFPERKIFQIHFVHFRLFVTRRNLKKKIRCQFSFPIKITATTFSEFGAFVSAADKVVSNDFHDAKGLCPRKCSEAFLPSVQSFYVWWKLCAAFPPQTFARKTRLRNRFVRLCAFYMQFCKCFEAVTKDIWKCILECYAICTATTQR